MSSCDGITRSDLLRGFDSAIGQLEVSIESWTIDIPGWKYEESDESSIRHYTSRVKGNGSPASVRKELFTVGKSIIDLGNTIEDLIPYGLHSLTTEQTSDEELYLSILGEVANRGEPILRHGSGSEEGGEGDGDVDIYNETVEPDEDESPTETTNRRLVTSPISNKPDPGGVDESDRAVSYREVTCVESAVPHASGLARSVELGPTKGHTESLHDNDERDDEEGEEEDLYCESLIIPAHTKSPDYATGQHIPGLDEGRDNGVEGTEDAGPYDAQEILNSGSQGLRTDEIDSEEDSDEDERFHTSTEDFEDERFYSIMNEGLMSVHPSMKPSHFVPQLGSVVETDENTPPTQHFQNEGLMSVHPSMKPSHFVPQLGSVVETDENTPPTQHFQKEFIDPRLSITVLAPNKGAFYTMKRMGVCYEYEDIGFEQICQCQQVLDCNLRKCLCGKQAGYDELINDKDHLVALQCRNCSAVWLTDHAGNKRFKMTLDGRDFYLNPPIQFNTTELDKKPVSSVSEIRRGDHIMFKRKLYFHHAIVVEVPQVGESPASPNTVKLVHWAYKGGNVGIITEEITVGETDEVSKVLYVREDPVELVIARAESARIKGAQSYDIVRNNCESLATYCKTGHYVSVEGKAVRHFLPGILWVLEYLGLSKPTTEAQWLKPAVLDTDTDLLEQIE